MCGILGTTNLLTSNEVAMQALNHIIQRGPDNQSIKSNGTVILVTHDCQLWILMSGLINHLLIFIKSVLYF